MKFYEVSEPYYALLKAENVEAAIKEYTQTVGEDDGTLKDEIKEVHPYNAILNYGRGKSEDGEEVSVKELFDDLISPEPMLLLIDGSLL
jgi:hypothetical protein